MPGAPIPPPFPDKFPHSFGALPFQFCPRLPYEDLRRLEIALKLDGGAVPDTLKDACRKAAWMEQTRAELLQLELVLGLLGKRVATAMRSGDYSRLQDGDMMGFVQARTTCERRLVEFASLAKATTDSLSCFINDVWALAFPLKKQDLKTHKFRQALAQSDSAFGAVVENLKAWIDNANDHYTKNLQNFRNILVHRTAPVIAPRAETDTLGHCPFPKRVVPGAPLGDTPASANSHYSLKEITNHHERKVFALLTATVHAARSHVEARTGPIYATIEFRMSAAPIRDKGKLLHVLLGGGPPGPTRQC